MNEACTRLVASTMKMRERIPMPHLERSLRRRLVCVTQASLGLLALCAGCSRAAKDATPIVTVQTEVARRTAITVTVTGEATLEPLHQAVLATKISAPVAKYFVQRGDRVHKGELLVTLENNDLSGAALGIQGQYEQAKAQYAITQATVPQEVQKAQLEVAQTQAQVDLQRRIYHSRKQLFEQGALPGRDVDQAKVALVQAKTQYDIARRHLEALEKVGRSAELSSATGQLQKAQGQYEQAQAMLAYTEIRSPINGFVTDRPLYEGEMAAVGTPVVTVMDLDVLIAKAHLPQAQIAGLRAGAPAQVIVPGYAAPFAGTVMLVSPALDPGSTTVEVWIRLANQDHRLQPGTPVHVSVQVRTIADALVVPSSALVQNAGGSKHVMVVGPDAIAHAHTVQTGAESMGLTQILFGLNAGDPVITVGAYALDDGAKVRIAPTSAGDAQP
jgi:HlyD family secretion protein